MFLKSLSITELNFEESWTNGLNKIRGMNNFDKFITIFWLLGPFIYLIERDPADLWLSLIRLVFLIRCIIKRDWNWTNQLWFKSALILWLFGLFSAITSTDPFFTFQQGFVWIRFPLYVAAAQVWLAKDRDVRILMLLSMLLGLLLICGILIAETIVEPKIRLAWPYGDFVPGGYIAKVSLPLFCVLIAIAVSTKNKAGLLFGLIGLISFAVSILTGTRTNTLLLACGGMLASIVWKPKFLIFSALIIIQITAVILLFYSRADLSDRFGKVFLKQIPITNFESGYWSPWRGGIQQGLITPIKGVGPSGTRKTCFNLDTNVPKWLPGRNSCRNHPHNFYIQLFAEVGVIGLFIGCIMFGSIIITCYRARVTNFNCPMAATAFVVPLGLFFPIQQFGSFYGQWGNLFTWFALGFAVSQYQSWRNTKKNFYK